MPDEARTPLAIGLLTHSVNPRGGVVHTLELADALHERGHRVTVFAPAFAGQALFRPTRCAVELVALTERTNSVVDMVATRRAAFVQHLERTLATRHFDVLHAQDGIGGNALADLVEAGRIEGFTRTVHHLDHFDDARLMTWQARAFTAASQVLCVSRTWCDRLAADFGVAARLVHNGVDLRRYTNRPTAQDAAVVARHGLRPGGPVFLAVGGVEERKNTLRMLQAFLAFRVHRPAAQLVIAGGASLLDHDAYGRQFAALLAASGAGNDVVMTGTVPDEDMPALFRAADALLMASLREGFGLVVLEALASGTPAVVSRIAPFTEYLPEDERMGHCCWADPHSVDAITAAMARACDPAHARALATATPAVCERFSWQASAAAHEALYRARCAGSRAQAALRLQA
ncbi:MULTISPECIES: MSMEG_0565 family glycosyltransferase [Ramlibacter]|uniref:MSMEG_0565 family glycosyltransferase n=1 Tax=Ramlibacter aquaticus TaxID=2780094 RepID=A0ABR9S9T0_9BURK|nr:MULTISPECIES: MSMEG_0565 family glycosyltransferase [Ramlibacter]MBE7939096.1 MSMEG_0565 family glycosyltransferase [Ramlibacter aquaticus]